MGTAGGVRSCVKDLLVFYKTFLKSLNNQVHTGQNSTPGSPLKHVRQLMSPHMQLPEEIYEKSSYGLGWTLTDLPAPMGAIGLNPDLVDETPVVGREAFSRKVVYHQGSLAGALSAVNLFPETESVIVVLSNTLGLNDCLDWVAQLLKEALFEAKHNEDYISWAKASADGTRKWEGRLRAELAAKKTPGTSPREFEEYVGKYFNSLKNMFIEVQLKDGRLSIAFQGLASDRWALEHYEHDIFAWLPPFNDLAGSGREALHPAEYFTMKFVASNGGKIDSLYWKHDSQIPGGEKFTKQS